MARSMNSSPIRPRCNSGAKLPSFTLRSSLTSIHLSVPAASDHDHPFCGRRSRRRFLLKKNIYSSSFIFLLVFVCFLFILCLNDIFFSTIINTVNNHKEIITSVQVEDAKKEIPPQCHLSLEKFATQQNLAIEHFKPSVILACHRKWCHSLYGHCQTVNGIGDRTRHALSLVTDIMQKGLRLKFDYPNPSHVISLRFPNALEYIDRYSILSELFHFRSYDVQDKLLHLDQWEKQPSTYIHFMPNDYIEHSYDPCLYHILFKQSESLKKEIDFYSKSFNLNKGNVIGIHFRTGDYVAFGVKNEDVRATGASLQKSYDRMMQCATALASKLQVSSASYDNDYNNHDHDKRTTRKFHFYLATDNKQVKEMAKLDKRNFIYTLPEQPTSYLRNDGDKMAYLELHLLSQARGLVMNKIPKHYHGPADEELSTFAVLAKNIGFMTDHQIWPCSIE